MLQRYMGAIKHFMAYLAGSFGHTGGDLKEIESEKLILKLKVYCCRVLQFCSRNFSGPISDAAVPGRLPQIQQWIQLIPHSG